MEGYSQIHFVVAIPSDKLTQQIVVVWYAIVPIGRCLIRDSRNDIDSILAA